MKKYRNKKRETVSAKNNLTRQGHTDETYRLSRPLRLAHARRPRSAAVAACSPAPGGRRRKTPLVRRSEDRKRVGYTASEDRGEWQVKQQGVQPNIVSVAVTL